MPPRSHQSSIGGRRPEPAAALTLLLSLLPVALAGSAWAQGVPTPPPQQPPAQPTTAPPPGQSVGGPRAIDRYDPKLFDVRFEVVMAGFPSSDQRDAIALEGTPFVLPIVIRGPFSIVDPASLKPVLILDNGPDRTISQRARLEEKGELGMTHAIIPVASFSGSTIRWSVAWRAQVWSCRVDEVLLARKTWPREWPEDVRDALRPQKGIESDRPFAKAIVESAVGNRLRTMPPWHAAKEIIRAVCIGMNSVSDDAWERRAMGRIIGLKMEGAARAAADARGTTHDLVAVTVAALRAAGIPARPVVGFVEEVDRRPSGGVRERTLLQSWAEVYMPDAGWIPFDPKEIRGKAVRQLKVEDPWPTLGHWKELNERVPIAWCFAPQGYSGSDYASLWGWAPRGEISASRLEATIQLEMISRGRGKDDPGDTH
jgi:hypothetical protein